MPPGYDRWVALVGNSRYYNYTLSIDGHPELHSDDYQQDYLTDLLVISCSCKRPPGVTGCADGTDSVNWVKHQKLKLKLPNDVCVLAITAVT